MAKKISKALGQQIADLINERNVAVIMMDSNQPQLSIERKLAWQQRYTNAIESLRKLGIPVVA